MDGMPTNLRRISAVVGIAIVCGGLAGFLVASIDDDGGGAVAQAPLTRNASGSTTPASIYSADAPAVVTVTDAATTTSQASPFLPPTRQKVQQLGSGFVIDTRGDIVTNDHVVAGGSDIRISFGDDGHTYPAKVVGEDPATDVAVVRMDAPQSMLHPLTFASSGAVQPGDPVYAIGNPFGLERTMTAGIVSAVGRDIQAPDGRTIPNAIQTDAAINHGNSGGPLIDVAGRVIGIASQIQGGTVDANVGVGFAVPADTAKTVAQQLIDHGKATHAYLGVQVGDGSRGVVVAKVDAGSPAAKAGLEGGRRDVIASVDGHPVRTGAALSAIVAGHRPGDELRLHVLRGDASRDVTVTLAQLPSSS
jgi:putative serine protease PepD